MIERRCRSAFVRIHGACIERPRTTLVCPINRRVEQLGKMSSTTMARAHDEAADRPDSWICSVRGIERRGEASRPIPFGDIRSGTDLHAVFVVADKPRRRPGINARFEERLVAFA